MQTDYQKLIKERIEKSIECKRIILENKSLIENIQEVGVMCANSIRLGGKIIFAGNGGSFADAQHIAAEFVSRLYRDRSPLPSIALGTNSSCITAIGNDYSFDLIYSRELECLGKKEDIFIGISTSGASQNIINAVDKAKEMRISAFGLTSIKQGKLSELCKCLEIPSRETTTIQESHIMVGHIMCEITEKELVKLR